MSIMTLSCAGQIDSNQIIGSWKLRNVVDNTKMKATDKVTFDKKDSVTVEIFTDGKLFSQMKGKYELNTAKATLTTAYDQGTFTFKIIKLTKEELELENPMTKMIDRYIRY